MDNLLKRILMASGIPGQEKEIAGIMFEEFKKITPDVHIDNLGNVIARKGRGKKKIMLAAHMDEVGLLVKHITKEGFVNFIKVGGIDDRVLPGQRVVVKAKKGDCPGIIGAKPPHLLRDEERKQPLKHEDMFIDIGARSLEEANKIIEIGDAVVFEPNCAKLSNRLCLAKAVDDRVGCYALIKILEQAVSGLEVYAVATSQEEVGLKGARTASYKINPDLALVIDTTVSGDTPQVRERESSLKLGQGVAITLIEACGRGLIVNEKVKGLLIDTAKKNKIRYQIDVIDGGMTDGAMIYMNREGIPTGVLSIPSRYIHSPSGVFNLDDLEQAVRLATKLIQHIGREK